MSQKPHFVIPTVDVVKLPDKEYFYDLKRKFFSLDFVFEDQELFEDFMCNPELNLIEDEITIREYDYEVSEEVEGVDKNGVSGISSDEVLSKEFSEVSYDFYTDYIIPGLEKGKKAYLLGLKKSLVNADKFKEHILIGFFAEKKIEIRTALEKITEIHEFEKRGFNTELENNLYQILSQINSCEQMYFPIDKIHLDLDKVQVLFLFQALTTNGIIKGLSSAKLYMLVEKYFTYGKDSLPISAAYKAIADYFPSEKQSKARKKISKKTFDDLDTKFNTLFDFLKE